MHGVAAGGAALAVVHFVLPAGAERAIAYSLLSVACLVAMAIGIRRNRPTDPTAWWLVVAGNGLLVAADITYGLLDWHGEVGATSWADVLYLGAYPVLGGGLYRAARQRLRSWGRLAALDGTVFGLAAGLAMWGAAVAPALGSGGGPSGAAAAVTLAYPVLDLAIIVVWLRLVVGGTAWRAADRYATVGLAAEDDAGSGRFGLQSNLKRPEPKAGRPIRVGSGPRRPRSSGSC